MATRYVVTAPYVTLQHADRNGQRVVTGFYAGAPVPDTVDEQSLRRHLEKGMVAAVGSAEAEQTVPVTTPVPADTTEGRPQSAAQPADRPARQQARQAGEPPAANAPKADWVEHAVAQGEDRGKAEGMSKEQLVGRFGKRG